MAVLQIMQVLAVVMKQQKAAAARAPTVGSSSTSGRDASVASASPKWLPTRQPKGSSSSSRAKGASTSAATCKTEGQKKVSHRELAKLEQEGAMDVEQLAACNESLAMMMRLAPLGGSLSGPWTTPVDDRIPKFHLEFSREGRWVKTVQTDLLSKVVVASIRLLFADKFRVPWLKLCWICAAVSQRPSINQSKRKTSNANGQTNLGHKHKAPDHNHEATQPMMDLPHTS